METANPFDLLLDNENDDISLLISSQQKFASTKLAFPSVAATIPAAAKLPSKPLPPAQAVRESRNNITQPREGTGRGGPGRGRGGRGAEAGQNTDFENGNYNRYGGRGGFAPENGDVGNPSERGRGSSGQYRGSLRGGRRGGYVSGGGDSGFDAERPQRRVYERRSGTGIGYEMKREGAGRGNWGTVADDVLAQETEENVNLDEKVVTPEKQVDCDNRQGANTSKDKKEDAANEAEKELEDNEMTLEEYEKIREEKRKALLSSRLKREKLKSTRTLSRCSNFPSRKETMTYL